jgi:hypothetical protein
MLMRGFVRVASLFGVLAISAPAFAVETPCFEVEKVKWEAKGSKVDKKIPFHGLWDFKTSTGIRLSIHCGSIPKAEIKDALEEALSQSRTKDFVVKSGPTVGTEDGNKVAHVVGVGTYKDKKLVIAKVVSYLKKSQLKVVVTIKADANKGDEVEKLMAKFSDGFEAISLANQAKMLKGK